MLLPRVGWWPFFQLGCGGCARFFSVENAFFSAVFQWVAGCEGFLVVVGWSTFLGKGFWIPFRLFSPALGPASLSASHSGGGCGCCGKTRFSAVFFSFSAVGLRPRPFRGSWGDFSGSRSRGRGGILSLLVNPPSV
jgi:hypothetical protein